MYSSELLCCVKCKDVFSKEEPPITNSSCNHLFCRKCVNAKTVCPLDKVEITKTPNLHYINGPVLSIVLKEKNLNWLNGSTMKSFGDKQSQHYLEIIETQLYKFADYLFRLNPEKGGATVFSNQISRTVQRKLFSILCTNVLVRDGRNQLVQILRTMCERIVSELILRVQCNTNLSSSLWSAVRARGCQFLGPAMQEDVLKLIRHVLQKGELIARKTLVLYVVEMLEKEYPHISKTCVGHVVQLLYRASCFNVIKREEQSSLMQLKEEFRTYDALRSEHDTQVVQIAMEAGLRISPDQWSSLLYGDTRHRAHMQSICDRLSTNSLKLAVEELKKLVNLEPSERDLFGIRDLFEHFDALLAEDMESANMDFNWPKLGKLLKSTNSILEIYSSFLTSWKTQKEHSQQEQGNYNDTQNHNKFRPPGRELLQRTNYSQPLRTSNGNMPAGFSPSGFGGCNPPPMPLFSPPGLTAVTVGVGSPPNFIAPPPLSLSPIQNVPIPMGRRDSISGYMNDPFVSTTLLPMLPFSGQRFDEPIVSTTCAQLMPNPSTSPTIFANQPSIIVFSNNPAPTDTFGTSPTFAIGTNPPGTTTPLLSASPPPTFQLSPGGLISTTPGGLISSPAYTIPVPMPPNQPVIVYGSTPPVPFPYGSPPLLFPQWITPMDMPTNASFTGLFGPPLVNNINTTYEPSFHNNLNGLGEQIHMDGGTSAQHSSKRRDSSRINANAEDDNTECHVSFTVATSVLDDLGMGSGGSSWTLEIPSQLNAALSPGSVKYAVACESNLCKVLQTVSTSLLTPLAVSPLQELNSTVSNLSISS